MTREQGTGNREEVLGNFTFSYIFRFFYVHLLIFSINYKLSRKNFYGTDHPNYQQMPLKQLEN
ncbi:MAG: hypothetical protein ACK57R_05515 [Dolichospermum sp.]|nr:hypothetical protein [Anabaena sp. 49628_E55]